MGEKILLVLIGVVVGVGGALVVFAGGGEPGSKDELEVSRLRQENEEYAQKLDATRNELTEVKGELAGARTRVTELEQEAPPVAAEAPAAAEPVAAEKPTGPPTDEEIEVALERYGRSLGSVIMGGGEEAKKAIREFIARMTDEQVQALIQRFKDTADIQTKAGLAHALAQSEREGVVRALGEIALDPETGFLERRCVSHGMAFSDDDAVVPILEEIARNDADLGARANSAFGLARRGHEDGVALYAKATDEAFAAKDPSAMQYLGGFMLLGKKGLPAVRERLRTYEDRQSRLLLIEVVRSNKDREAIPALRALVDDPATDKSVRESAEKAIRQIEAQ